MNTPCPVVMLYEGLIKCVLSFLKGSPALLYFCCCLYLATGEVSDVF